MKLSNPVPQPYSIARIASLSGTLRTIASAIASAVTAVMASPVAAVTFGIALDGSVVMFDTAYCRLSPGDSVAVTVASTSCGGRRRFSGPNATSSATLGQNS